MFETGAMTRIPDGMEPQAPDAYGDRAADLYDELNGARPGTDATVARLAELAGDGPVLELGIGTGRVALPLVARGVEVHGIDASRPMVERLRAKPGGDAIPVTIADFADVPVDGTFAVVAVLFNTFFVLTDPARQRACMANAAARLRPGGALVVEGFVPDPSRYADGGKRLDVRRVTSDHAFLEATVHDPELQRVDTLQMRIGEDGIRTWPVQLRYSYPAELDAMAADAGLELESRWADWDRTPFTDAAVLHVSVYRQGSSVGGAEAVDDS